MTIIELNDVCKSYLQSGQRRKVLDRVDLKIQPGDFIWLRGYNGAGKTTLVKLILGLEQADSGTINVFGHAPDRPESKLKLGLMLQKTRAPEFLKIKELLHLICSFYPNPYSVQELLERSKLEHKQDDPANSETLSGGEERSLYFALAIAGNPELLILDEPTAGMSADARARVLQQIREFANDGKTILLISHLESDVDAVRDLITRSLVLEGGHIKEICAERTEQTKHGQGLDSQRQVIQPVNILSMLLGQTKVELLKLIRQPTFVISMLMLYSIVGFLPKDTPNAVSYLAGIAAINLFLVAVEKFSVQVAAERKQGWIKLLRITPLPAWIYLVAKIIVASLLSVLGIGLMFILGMIRSGVDLSASSMIALFLSLILGIIPFAIVGFALAYLVDASSISIVTTLMLGLALFTSGCIPLPGMPEWLQNLIPFSPFYHYAQLTLWSGQITDLFDNHLALHLEWLVWTTCAAAFLAIWAYRRDRVIS